MEFRYENQGSSSFMIYELSETEVIDDIGLGMISNNRIKGMVPVSFMQINNRRELRFNISSKISLESLLGNVMSRDKVLSVFSSICDILIEAEGYLLEERLFLLDFKYIFSDVSTGESVIVYLPILREGTEVGLGHFFKELIFRVQSNPSENTDYVARIINELNRPGTFNVFSFRNLIRELQLVASDNSFVKNSYSSDHGERNRNHYSNIQNQSTQPHPISERSSEKINRQNALASSGSTINPPDSTEIRYSNKLNNLDIGSYQADSGNEPESEGQKKDIDKEEQDKTERKGLFGLSFGGKKKETEKYQKKGGLFSSGKVEDTEKDNSLGKYNLGFDIPGQAQKDSLKSASEFFDKSTKNGEIQEETSSGAKEAISMPQNKGDRIVELKRDVRNTASQGSGSVYARYPSNVSGGGGTTILGKNSVKNGTTMLTENMYPNQDGGGYVPSAYLRRERTGEEKKITQPVFHIGRESSFAHYHIGDNPAISKSHADIIDREGVYFIKDTNSKNHTYINGQLLTSNVEYSLSNGDIVMMADEKFEFRIK